MITNYRHQNSCSNCEHCFIRDEYDESPSYYCLLKNDNDKRPLCGSVYLKETFSTINDRDLKKWRRESNKWIKWANQNRVEEAGICDNWKLNKNMVNRELTNEIKK